MMKEIFKYSERCWETSIHGSFSIPDLYEGASFDFVEDQAVLDKQQGHGSSIYALFAICSLTTGWKTLLGLMQSERQSQYHETVAVRNEEKQGGYVHQCELLQTSWNCKLLSNIILEY